MNNQYFFKKYTLLFFPLLLAWCYFLPDTVHAVNETYPAMSTYNTLILPLKVNTVTGSQALEKTSDSLFAELTTSRQMQTISREEISPHLNYNDLWPPSLNDLTKLPVDEKIHYIAAGTLTQIGNRYSIDIVLYDLIDTSSTKTIFGEALSEKDLPSVLGDLLDEIFLHTSRFQRIADIRIAGNKRIDSGAILRHIKNRTGDLYNIVQLRNDLKSVFKMGYFVDVQIEIDESDEGKIVTFTLQEKEVIGSVSISGEEELEAEDIKEVLTLSPNTILNAKEIRESTANIKSLYKEKGYYDTQVEAKLTYPKEERVNITFDIKEGKKVFVKEVYIQGNKTFSDDEIQEIIATSAKDWLSWITASGLLKRDLLKQDASRIGAFYQNNGFIEVKVGEPKVDKQGEWLYVTFNIEEGDRYKVGLIDVTGGLVLDRNTLLNKVQIGEERYYNRKTLRDDIIKLTDLYASKGFAFAEISPEVKRDDHEKRVDIIFHAAKGDLVHVNRIIVKGNTRTRDKVIRRNMTLDEREVFDATALKSSTSRLRRLDYFEEINITPEPSADQNNLMDIVVDVKEKPTGTFSVGAGYSSVDGMMFMGEISQDNFLGRGQRLAVQANLGGSSTKYNLSFTEPHLNDSKLLFGFDVFDWERDYDDYDKQSTGATLRFGYPIWARWKLFFYLGYEDSKLTNIDEINASQLILDSIDIETTHFYTVGISRDTRNKRFMPSKGSQHRLSVKKAGDFLGGDSSFYKLEATTSWYFPFRWDTVFHLRGTVGYVDETEDNKLPVYERFYLGGINTMRGFESGQISPRDDPDDPTSDRIGGDKMGFVNLEYIFPIAKDAGLSGLVFYDTGFVYGEEQDWTLKDLRNSVGFGFRWLSPMGPLRLEWGYNIDPKDDEDQSLWDFSIGGSF
jgi:outer membrane protein insertion porin family